jgi:hypothetical protein
MKIKLLERKGKNRLYLLAENDIFPRSSRRQCSKQHPQTVDEVWILMIWPCNLSCPSSLWYRTTEYKLIPFLVLYLSYIQYVLLIAANSRGRAADENSAGKPRCTRMHWGAAQFQSPLSWTKTWVCSTSIVYAPAREKAPMFSFCFYITSLKSQ